MRLLLLSFSALLMPACSGHSDEDTSHVRTFTSEELSALERAAEAGDGEAVLALEAGVVSGVSGPFSNVENIRRRETWFRMLHSGHSITNREYARRIVENVETMGLRGEERRLMLGHAKSFATIAARNALMDDPLSDAHDDRPGGAQQQLRAALALIAQIDAALAR